MLRLLEIWGGTMWGGQETACPRSKPSLEMSATKVACLEFWAGRNLYRWVDRWWNWDIGIGAVVEQIYVCSLWASTGLPILLPRCPGAGCFALQNLCQSHWHEMMFHCCIIWISLEINGRFVHTHISHLYFLFKKDSVHLFSPFLMESVCDF